MSRRLSRCNECLKVGVIGHTVEGEWKGHKTLKEYCLDCCKKLPERRDLVAEQESKALQAMAPIQRVKKAIAYLLTTNQVFGITQIYQLAGIDPKFNARMWRNSTEWRRVREEITRLTHAAVAQGAEKAVKAAVAKLLDQGEEFTVEDVCNMAGLSRTTLRRRYPELSEWVKSVTTDRRYGDGRQHNPEERVEQAIEALSKVRQRMTIVAIASTAGLPIGFINRRTELLKRCKEAVREHEETLCDEAMMRHYRKINNPVHPSEFQIPLKQPRSPLTANPPQN